MRIALPGRVDDSPASDPRPVPSSKYYIFREMTHLDTFKTHRALTGIPEANLRMAKKKKGKKKKR